MSDPLVDYLRAESLTDYLQAGYELKVAEDRVKENREALTNLLMEYRKKWGAKAVKKTWLKFYGKVCGQEALKKLLRKLEEQEGGAQ
jgi:ribosomal protein L44E